MIRLVGESSGQSILAVAQPPSTNDFLIDRVMWHFARGLAFAAHEESVMAAEEVFREAANVELELAWF